MPESTWHTDDAELAALVQRLSVLAHAEASTRAALMVDRRKAADDKVRDALRLLVGVAGERVAAARQHLLQSKRGLSRRRQSGLALGLLVPERKHTRVQIDERAALLGTVVPPLQVATAAPLSLAQRAKFDEVMAELLGQHESIESLDRSLGGISDDDEGAA